MLTLARGPTTVQVDPVGGGRVVQLVVRGRQLLMPATPDDPPVLGGCYPMVPWAGRVRDGRFSFGGHEVQLELDAPPHALHGLAYRRPWSMTAHGPDHVTLAIDLSAPSMAAAGWPFGGSVVQDIRALDDGVALSMTVTAGASTAMPLVFGWHPWLLRWQGEVEGHAVFDAGAMLQRGPDGLPTGERVAIPEGPWDDCMIEVSGTPQVRWPGVGTVTVDSDLDHLVVFDGHVAGICLEPQSGPPNAFNVAPPVLAPGERRDGWMYLRWRAAGG